MKRGAPKLVGHGAVKPRPGHTWQVAADQIKRIEPSSDGGSVLHLYLGGTVEVMDKPEDVEARRVAALA